MREHADGNPLRVAPDERVREVGSDCKKSESIEHLKKNIFFISLMEQYCNGMNGMYVQIYNI